VLSEVVDLLVGVVVRSLEQHLSSDASIVVLIHHVDAVGKLIHVDLFVADSTLLDLLLLHFVLLLEVALRLQVAVRAHALEAVVLGDETGRIWAGLVLNERVRVRRFRAEPCSGHQFGVDLRLESLSHFVDACSDFR